MHTVRNMFHFAELDRQRIDVDDRNISFPGQIVEHQIHLLSANMHQRASQRSIKRCITEAIDHAGRHSVEHEEAGTGTGTNQIDQFQILAPDVVREFLDNFEFLVQPLTYQRPDTLQTKLVQAQRIAKSLVAKMERQLAIQGQDHAVGRPQFLQSGRCQHFRVLQQGAATKRLQETTGVDPIGNHRIPTAAGGHGGSKPGKRIRHDPVPLRLRKPKLGSEHSERRHDDIVRDKSHVGRPRGRFKEFEKS